MTTKRAGWSLRATPKGFVDGLGYPTALKRGVFRASTSLVNRWQQVLSQPGRGRVYDQRLRTKGNRVVPVGPRPRHRASADGDAPAPDTGTSRASIQIGELGAKSSTVGTDRKSLAILQHGVAPGVHPAGIVIAPRPHADVAAAEAKDDMTQGLKRELSKVGVQVTVVR